ncbi:hypothetical protein GUITHDRAFT_66485 [Guillardia theta CCMP2712]|uniref:tRNA-dihydrouridine synthase n=1 Tax=Guillardia theta (strain CCMP2712) TaxID=905079 RepID=L1JR14_GUITC|nr:hypothetical protein GUITHDRAFT_66485 [Guillardia theta CCMP2712]EKX51006.1 hypothetical protein GUITHDRAFT_66485 [Guillardia theta CCMP2712]|eukprot:XP_005837986.1 hypothetical protein GUITHDRAFT_66485 [Guillardia theta CCMP2712]
MATSSPWRSRALELSLIIVCGSEELVSPWHWWRSLGSPRYVSAPMVNNSELAFRLLVRRHGVQLTYTPMIPAKKFISMGAKDRLALIEPHEDDRPLIVQFCSDEPDELLEAGRLARDHCDAIDLNLGCPQSQAARDHYGAVLMEEPELVSRMVRRASQGLRVPVTCKIRVFDNLERTVAFAKMLQASGCSMLTVHGRTRGCTHHEGSCNWDYIREVKEAVDIPVIANGGMIRSLRDVRRCLEHTGADAVMSAIGLLLDPRLFGGQESGQSSDPPDPQPLPDPIELALEYLELAKTIPSTPGKSMRSAIGDTT